MAGIEKVCELTGDYEGAAMYKYKRNSIQVLPVHRCHFAKHIKKVTDCVLFEFKPTLDWCYIKDDWSIEQNYCFYTPIKELQGRVNGFYYNYTRTKMEHVYFNIWDLLGGKPFISFVLDLTQDEFYSIIEENKNNDINLTDFYNLDKVFKYKILKSFINYRSCNKKEIVEKYEKY